MLHNAPNIFSSPLPSTTISLFFLFLPLLLPTACICTFTKHNFAKCICCSVSFVCMLLKCHYYWGEHAGNFIKYERKYANGKKYIFWCVFKCFWMQFWKTHKWHGCLPWYSVLLPLFITSGNYACKFTLYKYRTYYEHVIIITHNSTLFICCRSTMQQPA